MNTQRVTVKQYLVLASDWLDLHTEAMPGGGVKCRHCGTPIRVAAADITILMEDSVDKGAELSQVLSLPLPGCPTCEDSSDKTRIAGAADNELSLQSWAWIGLPSSTIRSEAS
jgi:hypothetical protein